MNAKYDNALPAPVSAATAIFLAFLAIRFQQSDGGKVWIDFAVLAAAGTIAAVLRLGWVVPSLILGVFLT